jgi:hypothetical protein
MKKVFFALLFSAALGFASTASAQDYKTAVGVRLSNSNPVINNSIVLKHFLTETTAVEAMFSFGDPLALGALLEIHKPLGAEGIKWYYGGGAYLGFQKNFNETKQQNETDVLFGAQGVLGLDYKFVNLPLNLSLDWKPELNFISDINFEPAAIGFTARFTF